MDTTTINNRPIQGQEVISNIATYPQPYPHMLFEGRPVRILACGNVEGLSPAFQYVDESLQVRWASQSQFLMIDQNCQPLTQAELRSHDLTRTSAIR